MPDHVQGYDEFKPDGLRYNPLKLYNLRVMDRQKGYRMLGVSVIGDTWTDPRTPAGRVMHAQHSNYLIQVGSTRHGDPRPSAYQLSQLKLYEQLAQQLGEEKIKQNALAAMEKCKRYREVINLKISDQCSSKEEKNKYLAKGDKVDAAIYDLKKGLGLALVKHLEEVRKENKIDFLNYTENHYEEEDFLTGDFTKFYSNEIIADTPFLLNKKEILPVGGHCEKCDAWSPFTFPPQMPLAKIDENLLKKPMEESTKPDKEEWDMVYGATYIFISSRFKQILEENNIKGYTLRPVISHDTGKESEKMHQLLANKSIIISALPEGETVQPFCDTCGTAQIPYDYDFAIKKEWIGEDDFFARDRYKGTNHYMSNRVFRLMREYGLTGLSPESVAAVV